MKGISFIIVGAVFALGGCTVTPSQPLSEEFAAKAKSSTFSTLVRQRFHEDQTLRERLEGYRVDKWERDSGGNVVYRVIYETNAKLAKLELDQMLAIFCEARGLGTPTTISVPLFSINKYGSSAYFGTKKEAVGCGTDSQILAAYLFDGSLLRIYGDTDSVAVLEGRKSAREAAVSARLSEKQKWREQETKRMRTSPRLNEMVTVNLATWSLKRMSGYELMDVRVANTGVVFDGRIRDIKPPMVLIENATLSEFPRVWVPLESIEAPSFGTPFDE